MKRYNLFRRDIMDEWFIYRGVQQSGARADQRRRKRGNKRPFQKETICCGSPG